MVGRAGGARHDRREARRGARRPWTDRRHLGRGGHGKVAPRGRVRADGRNGEGSSSRSASASRTARTRATSSGARSGRRCSASTTACRRTSRCGRWRRNSRRSTRRSCRGRRCWEGSSICRFPTTTSPRRSMRSCARPRSKGSSSNASAHGRARRRSCVVLEDCHWLDPLSRDLLEVLARALASLDVLLVLAYRPSKDVGGGLGHREPAAFRRDRCSPSSTTSTRRS